MTQFTIDITLGSSSNSADIYVSDPSGSSWAYADAIEFSCVGGSSSTIAVTGVSLDQTSLSLDVGQTAQLNETVSPSDATNQNVSWSSSNTSVATVSTGGLVEALAEGIATITVTTDDGGYTDDCNVTVNTGSSGDCQTTGNLLSNGSFENGTTDWSGNGISTNTWYPVEGSNHLVLEGSGSEAVQTVSGLEAGCSYQLKGYIKSSEEVRIGVRNFGGTDTYESCSSCATMTQFTIDITLGSSSNSADIYVTDPGGGSWAYADALEFSCTGGTKSMEAVTEIAGAVRGNLIEIYPNPASGERFFIKTASGINGEMKVVDVMGRVVFSRIAKGATIVSVPSAQFSKGMYFVVFQNSEKSESYKLMIK
jgi:hypothetical protein